MSMTKNKSLQIHEAYHKKTKASYKVINTNNFTYRHLVSAINSQLKKPREKILDIGCGAGTLCFYFASKGHMVTGIDISSKAIESCKKTANNLGLTNVSFKKTHFPEEISLNQTFDLVIFTEVIEHLNDDALALKKINSFLDRNGILILSTPSIYAPLNKLGLTKKFDEEVGHLRRYSKPQLIKLLRNNGFRIIKIEPTEGILRNFLFINPYAGKLVRYIKFFLSDIITFIDILSLKIFGESNYIIIAKKK